MIRPLVLIAAVTLAALPATASAQTIRASRLRVRFKMKVEAWDEATGRFKGLWPFQKQEELLAFKRTAGKVAISDGGLTLSQKSRVALRELSFKTETMVAFEVFRSGDGAGLGVDVIGVGERRSGRTVLLNWILEKGAEPTEGIAKLELGVVTGRGALKPASLPLGQWVPVRVSLNGGVLRVVVGQRRHESAWTAAGFGLSFRTANTGAIRLRNLSVDGHVLPASMRKLLRSAEAARTPAGAKPRPARKATLGHAIGQMVKEEKIEVRLRRFPEMPWEKKARIAREKAAKARLRKQEAEARRRGRRLGKPFKIPTFDLPDRGGGGDPWPASILTRDETAYKALRTAHAYVMRRKGSLARPQLNFAERQDPRCAFVPYLRGLLCLQERERTQARSWFRKAIEKQKRFAVAWRALGIMYYEDGEIEEALQCFIKARSADPKDPWNGAYLAFVTLIRGDLKKATNYVRAAKRKRPKSKALNALEAQMNRLRARPKWPITHRARNKRYLVESNIGGGLVDRVAEALNRYRAFLEQQFPLPAETRTPSRLWIFDAEEEYLSFTDTLASRAESTLGVYHPTIKTLLLFQSLDADKTRAVLFHEAFHQYLDIAISNAPLWFNEGNAEYWGITTFDADGKPTIGGLQKGRLATLRLSMANHAKLVGLKKLMTMSRGRFMNRRRASFHYAQSWALVHWLRHGEDDRAKELFADYTKVLLATNNGHKAWNATFAALDTQTVRQMESQFEAYVKAMF
ncbi:MAG: hypothetical protein CL908_17715 [Deltaproteobacteria bacterium]|nr:hypothetical protein [Deltaproteobacteria bacterium]